MRKAFLLVFSVFVLVTVSRAQDSFTLATVKFGDGAVTELIVPNPGTSQIGVELYPSQVLLSDGAYKQLVGQIKFAFLDANGNVLSETSGIGASTTPFSFASSWDKLRITIVAPAKGCDEIGNCPQPAVADPALSAEGSAVLKYLSANEKNVVPPSVSIIETGKKPVAVNAMSKPVATATDKLVIVPGQTTILVLRTENNNPNSSSDYLVSAYGDDGILLGVQVMRGVPAAGGNKAFDLGTPFGGFGGQVHVTNGTFTVQPVHPTDLFFYSVSTVELPLPVTSQRRPNAGGLRR